MKLDIKNRYNDSLIVTVEGGTFKEAIENANLKSTDLRYADLSGANLSGANLSGANLRYADLSGANLSGANLRDADLSGANLRNADLRNANLRNANLDFSCLPLWCGSFDIKVDDRIAAQIFCHFSRLDVSNCSPMVKYCHRIMINMFGKYMSNLFSKFRHDVEKI